MESFVEIDGIRMCYRKTGEGRPFILMHGWGCSMDTVASVERVAAETHTVYNIDFPGFGKSAEPDDVWGVERYASFMEKFASEMGGCGEFRRMSKRQILYLLCNRAG